jgi:hypothetical protein
METGYGSDDAVRFPALQDFSLLHSVQTESAPHPAPYPMGTGGGALSPASKAAGS